MIHFLRSPFVRIIDKRPVKVTGSSMEPLFQGGDLVFFKKITGDNFKTNDIVLVGSKDNFFVHRVIYRNGKLAVTRGDNNHKSDGFINLKRVLAKATLIKRGSNTFPPSHIYLIQSSHYLKEIMKLKRIFDKKNIRYSYLKGLPVHFYYEGAHPKKLYFDCDIIVDRESAEKVDSIFINSGYQRIDSSMIKAARLGHGTAPEVSYRKIISGFPVNFDIHFEAVFMMTQLPHLEFLYPKALLSRLTGEILETSKTIEINGIPLPILNENMQAIYLCLHFFHHNFRGIQRLELIHKVIEKSVKRDKKFFSKCSRIISAYELQNFTTPVFSLLIKYFKTDIPQSFMKSISPKSKVYDFLLPKTGSLDMFDSDSRINSGIIRFRNLVIFSPRPFYVKMLTFFHPKVILYFFYASVNRLSYFLKAA